MGAGFGGGLGGGILGFGLLGFVSIVKGGQRGEILRPRFMLRSDGGVWSFGDWEGGEGAGMLAAK